MEFGVNSVTDCTRRGGQKTGEMERKRWKSGRWGMTLPEGAKNFSEIKKGKIFLKMQWLLHWYIRDL